MTYHNAHAARIDDGIVRDVKRCVRCEKVLQVTAFHRDKTRSDGLFPYCKSCRVPMSAEYHKENAVKIREYVANWQARNPERKSAYRVRYAAAHPESARMKQARRRARRKANGVYFISSKDMRRLMTQDCAACHLPAQHIDHIVPISRGGSHGIGNLQMLCASCNWNKKDLTLVEWRARRAQAVA